MLKLDATNSYDVAVLLGVVICKAMFTFSTMNIIQTFLFHRLALFETIETDPNFFQGKNRIVTYQPIHTI